jgi:hypothetical protein
MKKDTSEFRDLPTDDDVTVDNEGAKRTRGRAAMRTFTGAQLVSSSASTKDKLKKANEDASKHTRPVPPPTGSNQELTYQSNQQLAHHSNPGGRQAASSGGLSGSPSRQHHGPATWTYPHHPPTTFASTPFAQQGPSTSNLQSQGGQIVRPFPVVAGGFSHVHYDGSSTENPANNTGNRLLTGHVEGIVDPTVFEMANAVLPQPGWISTYGTQEQFISAGGTQFLPPWTDLCPVWNHGLFFTRMASTNVVRAMSEIGIRRESFLLNQLSLVVTEF